jgi:multiple sugar transport system ATP-binding protein
MNKGRIEQLGTPKEIYNNPRTLFVAGFIGSPPMNLVPGEVADGVFTSSGLRVEGFGRVSARNAVLGVRPEDVSVVAGDANAHLLAPIYSVELTGESTHVTVQAGGRLVTLRADKEFAGEIDQQVGVHITPQRTFLFDATSEKRIDF